MTSKMSTLSLLRGWPYPDHGEGFWGMPTVTLNFCEEDYAITYYCAELCNTITNVVFVWLGVRGVWSCIRESHPRIFLVAFMGYLLVGFGSISFHATLKYPMQLVDELSMIYTTCLMMFASFSFARSKSASVVLGIALFSLSAFITVYYHITKDPAFHQAAYAALTAIVVFRGMWVMEYQLRPALQGRDVEQAKRMLNTMWAMVGIGLSVFLTGYFLWNLDNFFCTNLCKWRREIGLPWAVFLEGHGWWHILTGLAYYYITWGIWLRHCLAKRDDHYEVHWPSLLMTVPEIRRAKAGVDKKRR